MCCQQADPTPRTNRIEQDYQTEYPEVKVEARKLVKKSSLDKDKDKKTLDEVKLDDEVSLHRDCVSLDFIMCHTSHVTDLIIST